MTSPHDARDNLEQHEATRLKVLAHLAIVNAPPEEALDDLAWLAAHICGTATGLVSLVGEDRLWFKARSGLDLESLPRGDGFCNFAIQQADWFEVFDATRDSRYAELPVVKGDFKARFYAGAPLTGVDGHRYGMLCVLDQSPKVLSDTQREALKRLAKRVSDTLEMRRLQLLSQSREAALAELIDMLPDAVVTCDPAGILKEFNATARAWHGIDARSCPPSEWTQHFGLCDAKDGKPLETNEIPLVRAWRGERVRGQSIVLHTPDGNSRTVSCNATPLIDRYKNLHGAVCTMHDVTDQMQHAKVMQKMAMTDELTGLPNRTSWFAELDRVIGRSARGNHPVVLAFIDLNKFKSINDTFGHAAGDQVLMNVANRLLKACRRNDFVARLSGDEFVIVLDQLKVSKSNLSVFAAKVKSFVSAPIENLEGIWPLDCSIGFAWQDHGPFNAHDLMESADQAMYEAKNDKALPYGIRVMNIPENISSNANH